MDNLGLNVISGDGAAGPIGVATTLIEIDPILMEVDPTPTEVAPSPIAPNGKADNTKGLNERYKSESNN